MPPQLVGKTFVKGQSGNPAGGNASQKLQHMLRSFFEENHPIQQDKTRLRVYLEDAIKKDSRSIFQMFPYCYAKVPEVTTLQNPDGSNIAPIQILITGGITPGQRK